MKVMLKERGMGKTHEAIAKFVDTVGSRLIVITERERQRIIQDYSIPDNRKKDIIVARLDCLKGTPQGTPVIIDNADLILQMFLDTRGETFATITWEGWE